MYVATVLALLASVALGAHSLVGGARLLAFGAAAPADASVAVTDGGRTPAAPRPASVSVRTDDPQVDALVDTTARKYRISTHAMREVVDAAYIEARRNRLDPLLILAVMAVESRFNPIAESNFGATGLMQVIPRYHADKFSPAAGESVLDPHTNIRVGARVLKEYVVRGGNEAAGLQLYNGAASDPSKAYAGKVLAERARLRAALRKIRTAPLRGTA
jgi:hypothetical protein